MSMGQFFAKKWKIADNHRLVEVKGCHQRTACSNVTVRIRKNIGCLQECRQLIDWKEPQLQTDGVVDFKLNYLPSYFVYKCGVSSASNHQRGLNAVRSHHFPGVQKKNHALVIID